MITGTAAAAGNGLVSVLCCAPIAGAMVPIIPHISPRDKGIRWKLGAPPRRAARGGFVAHG